MDKREVMVSVLCLAHNHEAYIAQALESFVNQETDFRYEILVNDDASTDGTAAVIRDYAERYPELIRPFYQEKNLFSQGIVIYDQVFYPVARGKYFASIEGDDYWCDPHKLQLQVDFLESHPQYAACVHNTVIHSCDGSEPDKLYIRDVSGDRDVSFATAMSGMGNAYHTSALMARREFMIDPPKFYYTAYSYGFGDQPRALWFALNGGVWFIDRPMSVYRVRSNPQSWSSNLAKQYTQLTRFIKGELAMIEDLRPFLDEEKNAVADEWKLRREFELMFIEGRDKEQSKPPYDRILREQSFGYRAKRFIKITFPGLHRLYRKKRGYAE